MRRPRLCRHSTACPREPVPSSVQTQPSLDSPLISTSRFHLFPPGFVNWGEMEVALARTSPLLNEKVKKQILANKLKRKSISFIAWELSRSWTVEKLSKVPESYVTRKRPVHPLKITNAARRQFYQEVPKEQSSSRNLQIFQNLPITQRKVHKSLHESPNLLHQNRKTAPALTA